MGRSIPAKRTKKNYIKAKLLREQRKEQKKTLKQKFMMPFMKLSVCVEFKGCDGVRLSHVEKISILMTFISI